MTAEERLDQCECLECVMRRTLEELQRAHAQAVRERDEARALAGRMTDRVRRAVELAERAAVSLNAGELGDVELLLGLLVAPSGPAAEALRRAGVKIQNAREELEEIRRTA